MKQTSAQSTIFQGFLFSLLWASASVAGKFGLYSVEPLVLFNLRFVMACVLLLVIVYGLQRNKLPSFNEWKQLTIFGLFNSALYLGIFVLALKHVAAGITTLSTAMSPLAMSLMTSLWSRQRIAPHTYFSIMTGTFGIVVASYPLLSTSYATFEGLLLLALSMLAYSFGAVYYASVNWQLPSMAINAWQVLIAACLLLPFTLWMHSEENTFDTQFWLSELWMVVIVSVIAVQLWLRLLKKDPVRASLWLYLSPIFGFVYATLFLDEPFDMYTAFGGILVIAALYIGQRKGAHT